MNEKLFYSTKDLVVTEIDKTLSNVSYNETEKFIKLLLKSNKVFVIGAGRVMLMAQAFAKRIAHLGIKTYVVGETTNPSANNKDLLIACSSSGETVSVVTIAKVAKKNNLKIATITARENSTLAKLSNLYVKISAPTKLRFESKEADGPESKQPLGNLFEQSLLLFFDIIAIMIIKEKGISEDKMWKSHANLE
ncbi:MAG: 6-phospho-3-hexuloisomerase [Candidatus Firestonebacteria bacterium]